MSMVRSAVYPCVPSLFVIYEACLNDSSTFGLSYLTFTWKIGLEDLQ